MRFLDSSSPRPFGKAQGRPEFTEGRLRSGSSSLGMTKKNMSTYRTLGLILKKTDRGEADQLFSIYTKDRGKILALGKGAKKIQSKLSSSLPYFAVIDLMIAPGKNNDHIAGASLLKNFSAIKTELKKTILASFALEVVDKITKLSQPDPKIFILLAKYLAVLNDNFFTKKEWQVVKQAFVIKLLSLLGLAPNTAVASDIKKLNYFLKDHLDSELQTEKFLVKIFKT